jgi:hypothetical protein
MTIDGNPFSAYGHGKAAAIAAMRKAKKRTDRDPRPQRTMRCDPIELPSVQKSSSDFGVSTDWVSRKKGQRSLLT